MAWLSADATRPEVEVVAVDRVLARRRAAVAHIGAGGER